MKIEKYNISLEREFVRINSKNKLVETSFPKAFGCKEKNPLITADDDDVVFKIKTPMEENLFDAYDKFNEITNVVIEELYKINQYIWTFGTFKKKDEKINLKAQMGIILDEEFYDEIREKDFLPDDIEEANEKIKKEFERKLELIQPLFGKCKIIAGKNKLRISSIGINYRSKCGLSEADAMFLLTFIFGCLGNDESKSLKEEIKYLYKVEKKYNLKTKSGLESIEAEVKAGLCRFDEDSLTDEKVEEFLSLYTNEGHNARYCLQNYKKLVSESVVLIKDAIANGVDYEVLNELKSIVQFYYKDREEFVIEGNKTDKDTYIFPIITDDKFTSKQIMKEHGLNVPNAILLNRNMNAQDREELLKEFYNCSLVVKPRNTNYGTGITVFAKSASKAQIMNAVDYAFKFDENVLIEQYVKGMEYRFLVVNGKCLSVAHRRAASVVGNGKSTIKELIDAKNKEPWHFLTGTPVKMDEPVVEYLKVQGYDYETVLPAGKRVFLRTNSNCSTGGESVDMTEIMPTYFKKVAEKASRAFDAKICGVDIIIEDLDEENYSIIEINDNPGYSINEWPYEGKGEKIGVAILKLLNLLPEEK